MEDLPILLGDEDESEEFWRSFRCCWDCFSDEMGNRGYDLTVVNVWLDEAGGDSDKDPSVGP